MKRITFAVFVAVFLILTACAGLEGQGDKAWREAMAAPEGSTTRLVKQKEAYLRYKQAYDKLEAKGRKIPKSLLNSYLNSAIARIGFIFGETEDANTQAIRIIREDIESAIKNEGVSDDVKDKFARFLIRVAQNHRDNDNISRCMEELRNAKLFAADKTITDAIEAETRSEYANFQLVSSQGFMAQARRTREPLDFIRAEYYAKATLHFQPENTEAQNILSQTRRELIPFLTAYESGITDYIDTLLFNTINSDGALIAVVAIRSARGETQLDVELYNNSFSAIKPVPGMFKLVLTDGREVVANNVTFDRRVLEQKHNVPGRLTFRGNFNANNIKKLSFYHKSSEPEDEDIPAITGDKYFQ